MAVRIGRPPASVRPSAWSAYMAGAPVSSALLLFGLVVLVAWWRRGQVWPDRRRTAGLLIGAFVVALSASVAPEFVTALLFATFVVVALDSQDAVVAAIRRLQDMLGAPGSGSAGAAGALAR